MEFKNNKLAKMLLIGLISIIIVVTALADSRINTTPSVVFNNISINKPKNIAEPKYKDNSAQNINNFISRNKIIDKANSEKDKTKKSIFKSADLKSWGKYVSELNEPGFKDYEISDGHMVWVVKISYPDGIDTRGGFYENAELTLIYDSETGDLISFHVNGKRKNN
ncbi:hypothetical protein HMPREF1982_02579 [Clostridiales bacterium oral taxon 876 str. F0540]|nr:hypothetical protein HMPREF1982_02579 [Clostridiales bacterium oral taxon 876 str. F0540]